MCRGCKGAPTWRSIAQQVDLTRLEMLGPNGQHMIPRAGLLLVATVVNAVLVHNQMPISHGALLFPYLTRL